jgi:hypothetical protein
MRLRKQRIQAVVLVLFVVAVAYAKVEGPDPGYTGAPGDIGNCVDCHDTFHQANVGPGLVKLSNLPVVYNPHQDYTVTVTTQQSGRVRFGFQLTAVDTTGRRAGTFAALDGTTQVLPDTGAGGRQYIEHTEQGTLAAIAGSRTWQVRWTAPDTDIGTVVFYVAGNAANNSGDNQGDYIYTSSGFVDSTASHVTVAFESDPSGQTLDAGSHFNIDWTTTGDSNIDNIELRYSTDDGATFPITNLIFSSTDPSISQFDWTVPDKATNQAKVRILVGKKSGDAVQIISDRFTIVGSGGGPPVPVITGASASGKKLFVGGEAFGLGAKVYWCDSCEQPSKDGAKLKKVSNDVENPTTLLISKKGGKQIAPGSTVLLQVKNPDGTLSEPFEYMRPIQ